MQTRRDDELSATDWAFVVTPQPDGWKADALHGTAWQQLAASCSPGTCRTRISETGVRVR